MLVKIPEIPVRDDIYKIFDMFEENDLDWEILDQLDNMRVIKRHWFRQSERRQKNSQLTELIYH